MLLRKGSSEVSLRKGSSAVVPTFSADIDWVGTGDAQVIKSYRTVIPAATTWLDNSAFATKIAGGGNIDLEGGHYRVSSIHSLSSVTGISNGVISAAVVASGWSESGGIYSTTTIGSTINAGEEMFYLEDLEASSEPKPAVYPRPSLSNLPNQDAVDLANEFRYAAGEHWITPVSWSPSGGSEPTSAVLDAADVTALGISAANATEFFIGAYGGAEQVAYTRVTSFDESTKTVSFAAMSGINDNAGRFKIAFFGYSGLIQADGEYAFSPGTGTLHYRTGYGSPTTAAIPSRGQCFSNGNGTTFDNVVLMSNRYDGSSSWMIDIGGTKSSDPLVFQNCKSYNTFILAQTGRVTATNSQFYRSYFSFLSTEYQALLSKCRFDGTETKPCVFVNGEQSNTSTLIDENLIDGCYFRTPSVHAQGISLYQGAPKNSIVRNCIFHDCRAAISYNGAPGVNSPASKLRIENNLITTRKALSVYDGTLNNQATINAYAGVHPSQSHETFIRHNTVSSYLDYVGTGASDPKARGIGSISFSLANSDATNKLYVEGNLIRGSIVMPSDPKFGYMARNTNCSDGETSSNPYRMYAPAFSSTDLATPAGGFGDLFDINTFAASGSASTASRLSGPIGILWSNIPSESDLSLIRLDFIDVINATDVGAFSASITEEVSLGEDFRP